VEEDRSADRTTGERRWSIPAIIALAAFVVAVSVVLLYVLLTAEERNVRRLLGQARISLQMRNFEEAEGFLREALKIRPGNARACFGLGQVLEARDRLKEARLEYERSLRIDPGLFEATGRLVSVCLRLRDPEAADRAVGQAEERAKKQKAFPYNAELCFLKGQVLFARGEDDKAVEQFQKAVSLKRKLLLPRFSLARIFMVRRDFKEAEKEIKEILKISPANEEARICLATLSEFQGKPDVARGILEEIVKASPGHEMANLMLGDLLIMAKDFDSALGLAESVQGKNPLLGHLIKGQLFLGKREFDQAEKEFIDVVSLRPGWPKGHYYLAAAAAMKREDLGLVIRESKEAIRADPAFLPARFLLVEALRARGDATAVIQECRAILDVSPDSARAMRILFTALTGQKKLKEAEALFRNLLEKDPQNDRARLFLGFVKLNDRKVDEAIGLSREVLGKEPAAGSAYDLLAAAYQAKEDLLEAVDQLGILAQENPKFAFAHLHLAKIYLGLGRRDLAGEEFRRALAKNPDFAEASFGLALLFASEGKYGVAIDILRRLSEGDPKNVALLDILAGTLRRAGKNEEAIATSRRVLDHVREHRGALSRMALCLMAEGRLSEAQPYLEKILQRYPEMDLGYSLGLILALGGDQKRGARICKKALKRLKNPKYHLILSEVYALQKDFEAAIASSRNAKDAMPGAVMTQIMLFSLLISSGNLKGAEKEIGEIGGLDGEMRLGLQDIIDFCWQNPAKAETISQLLRKSIALRAGRLEKAALKRERGLRDLIPGNPFLLLYQAAICRNTGRNKEAIELYQDTIRANPKSVSARVGLGRLYISMAKYAEARKILREALSIKKDIPGVHLPLGIVSEMLGLDEEAAEEYALHLKDNPNSIVAANNLAWNYAREEKNLEKALELAEAASKRWPQNPQIADTLGWLYFLTGKRKEALPLLRLARKGLPRNPEVRYHYGRALIAARERRKGLGEIKTALLISSDFPGAKKARAFLRKEGVYKKNEYKDANEKEGKKRGSSN
jgi:tetratricopeptide (TPR) repeat protein